MNRFVKIALHCMMLAFGLLISPVVNAQLRPAQPAPSFSLNTIQGKPVEINSLQGKQLLILYFFDMDSRPSLEGLTFINNLARQFRTELEVYGISSSPQGRIFPYIQRNGIIFSVLHDTAQVRDLYGARQILPVGCLIGPGFKVRGYFQGGGDSLEKAMVKAVKSELQGRYLHSEQLSDPVKKTSRSEKKRTGVTSPNDHFDKTPRQIPVEIDREMKQGSMGKIISEKEW